jgi:hypothetical protein
MEELRKKHAKERQVLEVQHRQQLQLNTQVQQEQEKERQGLEVKHRQQLQLITQIEQKLKQEIQDQNLRHQLEIQQLHNNNSNSNNNNNNNSNSNNNNNINNNNNSNNNNNNNNNNSNNNNNNNSIISNTNNNNNNNNNIILQKRKILKDEIIEKRQKRECSLTDKLYHKIKDAIIQKYEETFKNKIEIKIYTSIDENNMLVYIIDRDFGNDIKTRLQNDGMKLVDIDIQLAEISDTFIVPGYIIIDVSFDDD